MAKVFSFASWNVEHFTNDPTRIQENVQFIQDANPDVFAIFEVEGKDVFSAFVQLMPTHNFFITEDLSRMEILVGVNRQFTAFVTQRHQLKSDVPTLRPGALATLMVDDGFYSILFLHMKSLNDPRSWGLRDDMILRIGHLKNALDRVPGVPAGGANFICVGDFNTMGMNLSYSDKDLSGAEELARYDGRFRRKRMRLVPKTSPSTWWGGTGTSYPKSDLDHVFASDHLRFKQFGDAEVAVLGWPEFDTPDLQTDWIRRHSDHAMLYAEVHAGDEPA